MDEDDGTVVTFDEVSMQDMVDDWSRNYAEGVAVSSWYYDCKTSTVLIRLEIESGE
jgi:hypothetical protein